jgi:hypothetical protein
MVVLVLTVNLELLLRIFYLYVVDKFNSTIRLHTHYIYKNIYTQIDLLILKCQIKGVLKVHSWVYSAILAT